MPQTDIFNRNTNVFGGSFSADSAKLTFPALQNAAGAAVGADMGLLVQQLGVNYTQQVARLYEVGQPAIYYVGGRTSGTINLDRVVGPRAINEQFYRTYGDVCRARQNMLRFSFQSGCGEDAAANVFREVAYQCHFCVITGISANVRAQDMIINEGLQIMFSSLLYTGR